MIVLLRTLAAFLIVLACSLASDIVNAQDQRLPLLINERGGPPIARWRVHAKVLEGLREARNLQFIVKYAGNASLQPDEAVVIVMAVRRVDLGAAARAVGLRSRIPQLENMLRREQRAREFKLIGVGSRTRLTSISPPPGYYVKKGTKR